MSGYHRRPAAGFTLIEVLVATGLLATAAIGVASLLGIVAAAGRDARVQTATAILARAKIEQLRSLVWAYEPEGGAGPVPRTDTSSDPSADPYAAGGPGLAASPPGTLSANVPPYVDYLDAFGRWAGRGAAPPPGAMYIRRWSIVPLPADPSRTMMLSVLVTTVVQDRGRRTVWADRSGHETHLVLLHTRAGK